MWETKGVHYSLESRKMVLRESLWFPLSAFSPATVTGADSGRFFLLCSLRIFLSHLNNLCGLQRAARVVPGALMLWTIARTRFHIFLLISLDNLLELLVWRLHVVFLQAKTECIFKLVLLFCCLLPGWDEGTELYRWETISHNRCNTTSAPPHSFSTRSSEWHLVAW